MPTYRTGAAEYVIQQFGGGSGAADDVADFIDGLPFGPEPLPSVDYGLQPFLSSVFRVGLVGVGPGVGGATAAMSRLIGQQGRSFGRGGYRPRLMPCARLTVDPPAATDGGFAA